ncbi:MAG: hypothetical protein FJX72_06210 [Armatimonadetes bacterium]|nr:hypothetical protein [Armatimonadota bacterium]
MRSKIGYGAMVVALVALAMPALAQGRGRGAGAGAGAGMGRRGAGTCMGAGYGRQAGVGRGGWWNRVTPANAEQEAFLKQVTGLHNEIRSLNIEIAGIRTSNGPADEIAKRENRIAELRAELSRATTANEKLIRDMGVPAPYGVCNGQGRGARMGGQGMGRMGLRGNGLGLRDGSGPNPNCRLKKK